MTAIEAVGTFLPPVTVSVSQSLKEFGFSEQQSRLYERFYGFSDIRLDPGRGLTDQLVATAGALASLRGQEHRVRYVLHARTMPVVAPYPSNPLREACEQLNLDHATAFSVTQHACASALLAVDMAGKLLAEDPDPDALALVIVAEKSFTACAKAIVWTGVMGESAAAALIKASGKRDRMLSYVWKTYGRFCDGPWMPEDKSAEFHETYPRALAQVIDASIRDAGLTLDDIALILPHNVNRMSWARVLKLLGIPGSERLYLDNQGRLGHCFGADSFISYESAVSTGRIRPGDHYLMTAVGLGATFSAMVFTH
jgi:3-oxoacyl-[acyl-carrier-protein] synthase III